MTTTDRATRLSEDELRVEAAQRGDDGAREGGRTRKDDLIEALAEQVYTWLNDGEREWKDAEESSKRNYRAVMTANVIPLFVGFVAEWLLTTGSAATFLSERWREEMGA